jgi:hypothetical protein
MFRASRMISVAWFVFIVVIPCAQGQDDKVFRALSPEATEKLLQDLKIEYKKTSSKKGDEHYYDLLRDTFKVRLTHFSPREMKLDCVFRGMPIDAVNAWNSSTRFSRASHLKESTGELTLLDYALDLSGGATTGTVKQFVLRFDEELKKYDKFVAANAGADVVLTEVTNDKLENLLKTQGINYTKKANKDGIMMFDFALNDHQLRLYNFGGKDLMIDTHYKKISLEQANRYNLNRKFIRVVNFTGKAEYTSLESNLDCEAGVTEGAIRNWIESFAGDARHFAEFTKNPQAADKK